MGKEGHVSLWHPDWGGANTHVHIYEDAGPGPKAKHSDLLQVPMVTFTVPVSQWPLGLSLFSLDPQKLTTVSNLLQVFNKMLNAMKHFLCLVKLIGQIAGLM